MRIERSRFIEEDLEAIADYIALDNPTRAITFIREIEKEVRRVGKNPLHYRLRPEHGKDVRMAVVGRYVILFRILGRLVRIERIVHGGRDLPSLLQ